MKAAAQRAKIEASGRRVVETIAPGARLTWREAEDGPRATVVLAEGTDPSLVPKIEGALLEAGATNALVVTTGDAGRAPAKRDGHADPLALGTTAPPRLKGARPEKARPEGVRRVVAVASGKGGVGKSTVASRLALALAAKGKRVGLLDLDVYGPSIPLMFGVSEHPEVRDGVMRPVARSGLSLLSIGFLVSDEQALAWRGPMVMGAVRQLIEEADWAAEDGTPLDVLVIDTPPGTGDAHLSMIQRVVLDSALLVTTPSPLALADLKRGAQLFSKTGVPVLGVVENMARTGEGDAPFGPSLTAQQLAEMKLERLASLPLDPRLGALPSEGGDLAAELLEPVIDALDRAPTAS